MAAFLHQETFEFLNVCQVHGFPKIMGVLTHLDVFKNNKKLRKRKKTLKQRFWTEIYQGAKLFYLSGMINGKYPKNEVMNLSRFISVMKFRPLVWRNTHPYVMVDRIEDITRPELIHEDKNIDRKVSFYGYVRGCNLKTGMRLHLPGVGDFNMDDVSFLPDPCPLPDKEVKSLNQKQKLLYAPMSDVGDILYDKDAVYINVPGIYSKNAQVDQKRKGGDDSGIDSEDSDDSDAGQEERPRKRRHVAEDENAPVQHVLTDGDKMVLGLQDTRTTITDKLEESEVKIFRNSAPLKSKEIREERVEFQETEYDPSGNENTTVRTRRKALFDNGDDDAENDDEEDDDDDEENDDDDEDAEVNSDDDEADDDSHDDDEDEEEDNDVRTLSLSHARAPGYLTFSLSLSPFFVFAL